MTEREQRTLEALDKVRDIMAEYDLWGVVGVVDTERAHWCHHLEPSWSCLHFAPDSGEVRIRAKAADFITPEQHAHVVSCTVGAVFSTRDFATLLYGQMHQLTKVLRKAMPGIKHESFKDMRHGRPKT